jgi:hypothetical protein
MRQTKIWTIVLSTHALIKQNNKISLMENLNPKMWQKKYKICKIFKLKNETKNKNLSIQIISIQYWCLFQTSKYLVHIAKNCVHYPSLET